MWSLIPSPGLDRVEVTVASGGRKRLDIEIHRTARLDRKDTRRIEGIPVTSPARTLLDLSTVLPASPLERAVAEAEVRRLVRRSEPLVQLNRHRGRRNVGALRALLDRDGGPALTRSRAEEELLRLVRAASLPPPQTNVRIGGYEVDFLWREKRVVVEVDGFAFHSSRAAFERDRRRDAELQGRGFTVIRVTWRQLVDEPEAVIARIAAALARASS